MHDSYQIKNLYINFGKFLVEFYLALGQGGVRYDDRDGNDTVILFRPPPLRLWGESNRMQEGYHTSVFKSV